jgi:hypothetical protein
MSIKNRHIISIENLKFALKMTFSIYRSSPLTVVDGKRERGRVEASDKMTQNWTT